MNADMNADSNFSEQLEAWLRGEQPKTLGALGDVFGEKSFAVTILFLMFVPALPLPTGGITHVFEAITVRPRRADGPGPPHHLAPGALATTRAGRDRRPAKPSRS